MKKLFFCLFAVYCALLAEVLLLGRRADASVSCAEYFVLYANAVPFRTLTRYVSYFIKMRDMQSFRLALLNIGGNFLLFLPMGFFLPGLFSPMRKRKKCFFTILLTVLAAELMQGILRIGVPDVDDLIVNMLGAGVGMAASRSRMRS